MAALLWTFSAAADASAGESLRIEGDVPNPVVLSREEFVKLPRDSVKFNDRGTEATFEGVLMHHVLRRAGVPAGEALHGKFVATYVLAEGSDGFAAIYSITETDPSCSDARILIADTKDGQPLGPKQGPYRVIVPQDKKAARAVRMLEKLNVVQVRK